MKKLSDLLAEMQSKESKLLWMIDAAANEPLRAVTGAVGRRTGNPLQSREANVARIAGDLDKAQRAREEVQSEIARWQWFLANQ